MERFGVVAVVVVVDAAAAAVVVLIVANALTGRSRATDTYLPTYLPATCRAETNCLTGGRYPHLV